MSSIVRRSTPYLLPQSGYRLHSGDQQEQQQFYQEILSEEPDLLRQRLHDTGNAQRFIAMCGGDVRYSPEMRKWLVWDGRRWKIDIDSNTVQAWAKESMREFLWQASDTDNKEILRWAEHSLNVPQLRHLLEAAQSEPQIPVELKELDRHPLLLNCRNGTFDLASRELRDHRREDLLTKLMNVDYDPGAQCPRWTAFLNEILPPELVRHLQKAFGYSLTADVSAKAIFVLFGAHNAGKSTLLGMIRRLLGEGEYAALLQIETLTGRSSSNNMLADLATVAGARFIQTSEPGRDDHLTRVLKALVQGSTGRLKSTLKGRNPTEHQESAKIFIDGNDLPPLSDPDDEAIFNRLHPIEFRNTIPDDQIDKTLPEQLEAEFPGILNFCIEGFEDYRTSGLKKPPLVVAALDAWREKCDNVPRFVEECCAVGSRFSVAPRPLFEAYLQWCADALERPASSQRFSRRIQRLRGCVKGRKANGRFYLGIKIGKEA